MVPFNCIPVNKLVSDPTDDGHIAVHVLGFEQRLLSFGSDPPPVGAVAQQDPRGRVLLDALPAVNFERLERRSQREPAVSTEQPFGVFGSSGPHQRELHPRINVPPYSSILGHLVAVKVHQTVWIDSVACARALHDFVFSQNLNEEIKYRRKGTWSSWNRSPATVSARESDQKVWHWSIPFPLFAAGRLGVGVLTRRCATGCCSGELSETTVFSWNSSV